jgi:hypothetical protein
VTQLDHAVSATVDETIAEAVVRRMREHARTPEASGERVKNRRR